MSLINALGPLSEGPQQGQAIAVPGLTDPTVYAVKVVISYSGQTVTVAALTKTAGSFTVDWGTSNFGIGQTQTITTLADASLISIPNGYIPTAYKTVTKIYSVPGTYYITVKSSTGYLWCIIGENPDDSILTNTLLEPVDNTVIDVVQWGTSKFYRTNCMFRGCGQLNSISASDTIDLTECVSMDMMFEWATSFNVNIAGWKTGNVSSMTGMFTNATSFNKSLVSWCVSKIPSVPLNKLGTDTWAKGSPLIKAYYPIWGTCPGAVIVPPSLVVTATKTSYAWYAGSTIGTITPVSVAGGVPPYTYSISPDISVNTPGVTYYPSVNTLSGIPTAASGSVPIYTITVKDSLGTTKTASFSVSVSPPFTVTSNGDKVMIVGVPVNFSTVTVSGGTSPYNYTISGITPGTVLPTGLKLNASTGVISGTPTTLLNTGASRFNIFVSDSGSISSGAQISLSVVASIISIAPITASKAFTVGVTENETLLTNITGGAGPYTYSISPQIPGLTMNPLTGGLNGQPTTTSAAGNYTVTVVDSVGTSANTTVSISVAAKPSVSITATSNSSFDPVTGILTVSKGTNFTATLVPADAIAPYTYSISGATLPAGVTFNAATGVLSGIASLTTVALAETITMFDANGRFATFSFKLQVIAISVTAVTSPVHFYVGTAVTSQKLVTVTGGTATFSISPQLPAGLTFNSDGTVSGNPTAISASTTYTVYANGGVVTVSCPVVIDVSSRVVLTAVTGLTLGINSVITPTSLVSVSGGVGPYSYSMANSTITGLIMNSSTGIVTGTPVAIGTTGTIQTNVRDQSGQIVSITTTIALTADLTVTAIQTSYAIPPTSSSVSYQTVTTTGGTAPFSYSIISSLGTALPAGLSLSSTGYLTGVPTVVIPKTTYTVTVTDAKNRIRTASFSLNTANTLVVTSNGPLYTSVGYSKTLQPVTVTGGQTPYSYAISTVPAGLLWNSSTGVLTGTPTASSSPMYTVTVTDANGAVVTVNNISIIIGNSLTVIPKAVFSVTNTQVSMPIVTASGGTGTYVISTLSPLPSGLTLNPGNGIVTGILSSTFPLTTFKVTVLDSRVGNSVTVDAQVEITDALVLSIAPSFPITKTQPTTITATVVGGRPPYTYTATFGTALQNSLSIDSTTGIISGTVPSAITAGQTVTSSITVIDAGGIRTSTGTFNTVISDPLTLIRVGNFISPENLPPLPTTTKIVTVAGGRAPYSYSISPSLPSPLALDPQGAYLTGISTPPPVYLATVYTITATDADNRTASTTHNIASSVTMSGPTNFEYTPNSSGIGTIAKIPFTSITGGSQPFTYTITGLPANFAFDSANGTIAGTTTAYQGVKGIQITATDNTWNTYTPALASSIGRKAFYTFNLSAPLKIATVITNNTYNIATVVSLQPVTVTGGISPYTFTISPVLPLGLTWNSATGAIGGSTTVTTTATLYTISITDQRNVTPVSAKISLGTALSVTAASAVVGLTKNPATPYPATPTVAVKGGSGNYGYSISPALPSGLQFNAGNGAFSGKPTVTSPATTYTVTVIDANNYFSPTSATFILSVI